MMKKRQVLLAAIASWGLACAPGPDVSNGAENGASADAGSNGGGDVDAGPTHDAGPGPTDAGPQTLTEMEPNNGTTVDEVNNLPVTIPLTGAIADATDADIFLVPTLGGGFYRVHLQTDATSTLTGHLTVMDSGRDGDAAGSDFVRLSRTATPGANAAVTLEFMAMGDGHLIAVRDLGALSGAGSGSNTHTYTLWVEKMDASEASTSAFVAPTTIDGALTHAGDTAVYNFFTAADFEDFIFDYSTTGDMDGRLFVVAAATGDWIARNDDRGAGDTNPLIDAPMTESGDLYLVVDNINEEATGLNFSIAVSQP
jgi:hypothetical protein